MNLTLPELLALVDIPYDRIAARLRRNREEMLKDRPRLVALPFRTTIVAGFHPRFDLADSLLLACAAELERGGLDFETASNFVMNASADRLLSPGVNINDFWIAAVTFEVGRAYQSGSLAEVSEWLAKHEAKGDACLTATLLNVGPVLNRLRARAKTAGVLDRLEG